MLHRHRVLRMGLLCSALSLALPATSSADNTKAPAPRVAKPALKARITIAPKPAAAAKAEAAPVKAAEVAPAIESTSEAVPKSVQEAPATHKQTAVIKVNGTGPAMRLDDFCLAKDGNVLALVTPTSDTSGNVWGVVLESLSGETAEAPAAEKAEAAKGGDKKNVDKDPNSKVRMYDAEGKQLAEWSVGFIAQAINLAPGGSIVVGGNGKVARFDATGKKIGEAVSPQMEYISKNKEEMRERAKEQLESDKAMYAQQVQVYEDQLKVLDAVKEEDQTPEQKQQQRLFKAQVKVMKSMSDQINKRTVEQALEQVTARALKTHSISASDKDVFIVCPAMAGYGFGVWRTTSEFGEPKEIIKSLSGCCGQMDVQCNGGELFVSENSRHRMIRYDREGKEIGTFGKRDREGEGENFGGCCNPMNCCFNAAGELYVAESNGVVKHFTPDGKFLGLVGVANVQPGCKNSAVAATSDDNRLFYIDVQKHEIIVLTKTK